MQQIFFSDAADGSIEITNILEIAGLGTPPVRMRTSQGYRQHGATVQAAAYDPRPFTISFDVCGKNWEEAAAKREAIMTFFARLTPKTMMYKHGDTELFLGDIWIANPYYTTAMERSILTGRLQLVAYNPFFYRTMKSSSVALETATLEYIDSDGGVEIDTTNGSVYTEYSEVQQFITVVNNGTSKETPAIIRFIAPATNPWVTNQTTGQTIKIGRELVEGEVLEIDTSKSTVKIYDALGAEHEAFNYISDDPDEFDFIKLNPGANIFTFGSDGNSVGHIEVGGYEYFTNIR